MIRLFAKIDNVWIDQGLYSQMNHVLSRITQLDTQYEFLELSQPTEYKIINEG